jgi:hypothetical protein
MENNTNDLNNNEIEIKQSYLRTEILEKGYDTSDFVEYLIGVKGEEAGSVENWTMEELMKVVEDYKMTLTEVRSRRNTVSQFNYSAAITEPDNPDIFEEIITCNKQEKMALSDCHNIDVIISE